MLKKILTFLFSHVLLHALLFAGLAVLLPAMTFAVELFEWPWVAKPAAFWLGIFLILIATLAIYVVKRSIHKTVRSVGITMLIPGFLALLFIIVGGENFFAAGREHIVGFATIQPLVEYYIEHSVPAVISVALVYLCAGLFLVWVSYKGD